MKGGINFEEWKEIVKKNRRSLRSKSNSFKFEPESLTYGAEKAVKSPEYGQVHTITYNVSGNVDSSNWPTEIKSGKDLVLDGITVPYGATATVSASVPYTYEDGVLTISNVQNATTITVQISDPMYENAKVGDYLYDDWTFGPTKKSGYIGRCIATSLESLIGKTIWCSLISNNHYIWSTEKVDTNLSNFSTQDAAKTDMNGKENTQYLLSLGADKYPAAAYAAQQFDGLGYLPAMGELSKYMFDLTIRRVFYAQRDGVSGDIDNNIQSSTEYGSYYNWVGSRRSWTPSQSSKDDIGDGGRRVVAFCQLSGPCSKPINNNGHEYVEIGGLKWATMNVGASQPSDYGLYFQWGDTQGYTASQVGNGTGQKRFAWADYKYGNGTGAPGAADMTKYNATDGKTVLEAADDAARANWGGDWRIPTNEEFQALCAAVNTEWTDDYQGSGISGLVCTDKTDSSKILFFPATGTCYDGSVASVGSDGSCWSSSLYVDGRRSAYELSIYSSGTCLNGSYSRYYGFTVRGVIG